MPIWNQSAICNQQSAISISICHIRNQRDLTGALDRGLQLALMHRAGARDAARQNLAALGDERPDELHVLVVDVVDLVRAELADLAAAEEGPALALPLLARLLVAALAAAAAARAPLSECHGLTPPRRRSDRLRRRRYPANVLRRADASAAGRASRAAAPIRSAAWCESARPLSFPRPRGRPCDESPGRSRAAGGPALSSARRCH